MRSAPQMVFKRAVGIALVAGAFALPWSSRSGVAGAAPATPPTDAWQTITTGAPIADVAFGTAATGWAVADGGVILRSTDGGSSWQRQPSGTARDLAEVDAVDSTRAWAAGADGTVVRTTDGGATWTSVVVSPAAKDVTGIDFVDAERGWAVSYGEIWATTDGGVSWKQQLPAVVGDQFTDVMFLDATHGWVTTGGSTSGRVWRTTDGSTWTASPYFSMYPNALNAVAFTDATHGVAVGQSGGYATTSDGGATWADQDHIESGHLTSVAFADRANGWAIGNGVYGTTNGGRTWSLLAGSPKGEPGKITRKPGGGLVATFDGGRIATSATGAAWTVASVGLGTSHALQAIDGTATNLVAVGDASTILASHDGGGSWATATAPADVDLTGVAVVDGGLAWAVGSSDAGLHDTVTDHPEVLKSTDGGTTWSRSPVGLPSGGTVQAVAFADADHGWIVVDRRSIYATSDGGATWGLAATTSAGDWYAITAVDDRHAWAVGSGVLSRTTDGSTWSTEDGGYPLPPSTHTFGRAITFTDLDHGWISGGADIWRTTDRGATWTAATGNVSWGSKQAIAFADHRRGWSANADGSVWITEDGGATWALGWLHTRQPGLTSLVASDADHVWAAGDDARIALAPGRRHADVALDTPFAFPGDPLTVTATVSRASVQTWPNGPYGATVPTGKVAFERNGTTLATVDLDPAGRAAAVVPWTSSGGAVVARYLGDDTYAAWPSTALAPVVRPAWYPFSSAEAFVIRQDRDLTGTTPSDAQAGSKAKAITTPAAAAAYIDQRLDTAWSAGYVGQVNRLYRAVFLRDPDASGLNHWVGRLRSGSSLSSVAGAFLSSGEYQRAYGGNSDEVFLTRVYSFVLDRQPDAGGKAYWLKKMAGGTARRSVVLAFSESSENLRRTKPSTTVQAITYTMLGRAASAAEVTSLTARLEAGTPRATLITETLRSRAYATRIAG